MKKLLALLTLLFLIVGFMTVPAAASAHTITRIMPANPSCNTVPNNADCNGQPTPGGCINDAYQQRDGSGKPISVAVYNGSTIIAYGYNLYSPHCMSNFVGFQCVGNLQCSWSEGYIHRASGVDGGVLDYHSPEINGSGYPTYDGPLVFSPHNQTSVHVCAEIYGVVSCSAQSPLW